MHSSKVQRISSLAMSDVVEQQVSETFAQTYVLCIPTSDLLVLWHAFWAHSTIGRIAAARNHPMFRP
jgi:hypothetical protein